MTTHDTAPSPERLGALTDYQRGYVDGFNAPADVDASPDAVVAFYAARLAGQP